MRCFKAACAVFFLFQQFHIFLYGETDQVPNIESKCKKEMRIKINTKHEVAWERQKYNGTKTKSYARL